MYESYSAEFDPFHRPTPYEVLEINNGIKASAKHRAEI